MDTQQLTTPPDYRGSSMDKLLMSFAWMRLLVQWVEVHKTDHRLSIRLLAKNLANLLTAVRIAFGYTVPWLVAVTLVALNAHHSLGGTVVVCAWTVLLIGLFITDAVDGTLSNQAGIRSRFGEIADPLADKWLIACTVYWLVWAAVQILPRSVTLILVPVVVLVVVFDVASAIITMGEEVRARLIHAQPAKTEQWGKRKLFTQCIGAGLLLVGLIVVAAGASGVGLPIIWPALAILALAVVLAMLSDLFHWRNLAGHSLTHIMIAITAPASGIVLAVLSYLWLQHGFTTASLMHAAEATAIGAIAFIGVLTVLYLPQAIAIRRQPA